MYIQSITHPLHSNFLLSSSLAGSNTFYITIYIYRHTYYCSSSVKQFQKYKQCQQSQQCKQCIKRCYLHLWWYFSNMASLCRCWSYIGRQGGRQQLSLERPKVHIWWEVDWIFCPFVSYKEKWRCIDQNLSFQYNARDFFRMETVNVSAALAEPCTR